MIKLICPICSERIVKQDKSYICKNNHCFDIAKEGYVNLLTGKHKDGSLIGDNKDMALSRKQFLEKGYFDSLLNAITEYIKASGKAEGAIADICCGEGYYGHKIRSELNCELCGFDISKEMIRLASKRKNNITYFVANLARIPLESKSVDLAFHLFAPFHEKELSRILKDNGIIITVVSGENHLFELKELLYDTPYKNDEKPPLTESLKLAKKIKISDKVLLESAEDIDALFKMTPYYYHTSDKDKMKLADIKELSITTEFVIYIFSK